MARLPECKMSVISQLKVFKGITTDEAVTLHINGPTDVSPSIREQQRLHTRHVAKKHLELILGISRPKGSQFTEAQLSLCVKRLQEILDSGTGERYSNALFLPRKISDGQTIAHFFKKYTSDDKMVYNNLLIVTNQYNSVRWCVTMKPGSEQLINFHRYGVIGRHMESIWPVEVVNGVLVKKLNRPESEALTIIEKKN